MPFPLIKLAILFIKQASKPIGNRLKIAAKTSPTFKIFAMKTANVYQGFYVNARNKGLGFGNTKGTSKMNPETATELGADLLGEAFMYSFFASLVCVEYWYSSNKASDKREEEQEFLKSLEQKIIDLGFTVHTQDAQIRALERSVLNMESINYSLQNKVFGKNKTS